MLLVNLPRTAIYRFSFSADLVHFHQLLSFDLLLVA